MLPKKGKRFPNRDGKGSAGLSYPRAIAAALRGELGDTHHAIKIAMRWTGAGERSAKNWLSGTRGPNTCSRSFAILTRCLMRSFGSPAARRFFRR